MSICNYCPIEKNLPFWKTKYWNLSLSNNQTYLGRCVLALNRHAGAIPELMQEEWNELFEIVKKFESAAKKAFGATSVNWTCLMNHAYKQKPYSPHVHWHPRPRYGQPVEFAGEMFTDEKFGRHYEAIDANRKISNELRKKIKSELLKYLR